MTEVDIIKKFNGDRPLPFDCFLTGGFVENDETKDAVIRLIASGVLKSKVDNTSLKIILKMCNSEKAKSILHLHELSEQLGTDNLKLRVLSNKDDLPCRPGMKYEDSEWERYIREIQLAENSEGKFAILDKDGNPLLHDWFDNVCLVTYQSHPCHPEDTVFGIVVEKNKKFACVKEKGATRVLLLKRINTILKEGMCELTPFDYRQYKFEYNSGDQIYQAFWGYERTWIVPEEKLIVHYDKDLMYHENIMANGNPYGRTGYAKDANTPYYIYYKKKRKFYAYSDEELQEFLAKYEENKKNGNMKGYKEQWEI